MSITSLLAICFTAVVVRAGGWDNFKLRYFHLTSYLHNQEQELVDIGKQNIIPEQVTRIDLAELLNGGPPKDGIPSIDNPQFDTAQTTPFRKTELVIGVEINGQARAYPLEHRFSNAKNYFLGYSANEISAFENPRNPRIGLDSEY